MHFRHLRYSYSGSSIMFVNRLLFVLTRVHFSEFRTMRRLYHLIHSLLWLRSFSPDTLYFQFHFPPACTLMFNNKKTRKKSLVDERIYGIRKGNIRLNLDWLPDKSFVDIWRGKFFMRYYHMYGFLIVEIKRFNLQVYFLINDVA